MIMPGRDNIHSWKEAALIMFAGSSLALGAGPEVRPYSGNRSHLPIQGEIKEAKSWLENGDSNVVIVSEISQGKPCEKDFVSRLFGYRLLKKSDAWKVVWKIQDHVAPSSCQETHYIDSSLQVEDVDGVGMSETVFFYWIAGDGTDPVKLKMMFHFNGNKLPIRGKIPWTEEDSSAYEMTIDPSLKKAPIMAQKFALKTWTAFMKKNYADKVPQSVFK
jgi:hypothetical protein